MLSRALVGRLLKSGSGGFRLLRVPSVGDQESIQLSSNTVKVVQYQPLKIRNEWVRQDDPLTNHE